jgi:hypothetical protein
MTGSVQNGQTRTCWIESFVDGLRGVPSPDLFLKWSAIAIVGAAMARRVWSVTSSSAVFPNLLVLMVAPPGVGKTVGIRRGMALASRCGRIKMAPSDMTKASLLDAMESALEMETVSSTELFQHHSLFVGLDELGTMISSHDMSMMSVMNALYDNNDVYKETRRGREEDLILYNPQLALLAGTQPDFLANLLPPEAWGMGFMSRMIMVYWGKPVHVDLFSETALVNQDKEMSERLTEIGNMYGQMQWSAKAKELIMQWHRSGMAPVPSHSKLKHYCSRRVLHVLKLSMISSAARGPSMLVDEHDFTRALDWLFEVENLMPDIFKDMEGKSDVMVIADAFEYLWKIYTYMDGNELKKKAFHRSKLEMFLMARTPAYNVRNIVQVMVGAEMLVDKGADMFEMGKRRELQ